MTAISTAAPARGLTTAQWLLALVGLNAMWVTDLLVMDGGLSDNLLTVLGRATGLYGALLLVFQLFLIARVPWLERGLGMDQLTRWHRWTGFWVLWLLLAHVVFITLGYAASDGSPVVTELGTLVFDTGDVLKATVAMILLVVVAVTSARAARRKMRYETWHFVHLYAYLAVILGFLHQVTTGRDFVGSPVATAYWWTLYGGALTAILAARVLLPLWRNARHQLRVHRVVAESPSVVSVYITGKRLHELPARAGQFFLWRFLTKDRWWEAHPYSLSAMPNTCGLRITVKALGDGSAWLRTLKPGTRVFAEGPYGAFTSNKCGRRGALLIGGGVGITPIRALMEELRGDVVAVYRANQWEDTVLANELRHLAQRMGARLHMVVGPVDDKLLSAAHLAELVPDVRERDVFVCGPPGMTDAVLTTLRALAVPAEQCHAERFAFAA
ncbi:ferredoxin reductase family protein [Kutzneria kofuensis]|uniref:Putative ferric reductase n=1 Tax=Kutzneria kofuensis TaxID=103725 RepID=A0A7W9KDA9_9PSEU|nr:ferredoxin reductase family protein [Kutzneria kofuensis]MBB5890431.1 putative ferric reductase [Kutzneria kofuensis]